jgi:hypothetical protein
VKPRQLLSRDAYLLKMQAQINEAGHRLDLLQGRAEAGRIKAELNDIFNLRAVKDLHQRRLCELGIIDDDTFYQLSFELERQGDLLMISIEKLKIDFDALAANYQQQRAAQLEALATQLTRVIAKVQQFDTPRKLDFYDDIQILCLKHTTAIERLQALKANKTAIGQKEKASFESAWYELLTALNSVITQLAEAGL